MTKSLCNFYVPQWRTLNFTCQTKTLMLSKLSKKYIIYQKRIHPSVATYIFGKMNKQSTKYRLNSFSCQVQYKILPYIIVGLTTMNSSVSCQEIVCQVVVLLQYNCYFFGIYSFFTMAKIYKTLPCCLHLTLKILPFITNL